MKREGRQHGVVRTYRILPAPINPRAGTRTVNRLDLPSAYGIFTKVPSKPTNHSKFTGKCERPRCIECHMSPATKAAHKAKGARKPRWSAWWADDELDSLVGLDSSSARGILDNLYGGCADDDSDGHDHHHEDYDDGPLI